MKKENLEQIGFLLLTAAALLVAVVTFVPGTYDPVAEFFLNFGSFLGAAAGVMGAYLIAAWQMNRQREDRRIVAAHRVGLQVIDLLLRLRLDITSIADDHLPRPGTFRDPHYMQEIVDRALDGRISNSRTERIFNETREKIMIYETRQDLWSCRDEISIFEWRDYFDIYIVFRRLEYMLEQYRYASNQHNDNPMRIFNITIMHFLELEEHALSAVDSLRRKYVSDLPRLSRQNQL